MPSNEQKPTNEDIASAAYNLYVESGYLDGHDQEHWLQAENQLTKNLQAATNVQGAQSQSKAPQWNAESTAKPAVVTSRAA